MEKIFEILKKANFTKLGDQEEFWIDIHHMLSMDDLWKSLITESVAVTKPEIVSLFLYSLIQEYVTQVIREDNTRRESGQTKALDLTLTRGEEKVIYYVAGYVVFSLRNKYMILKNSKNRAVTVAALQFLDSVKIDGDSSFKSRSFNMYIEDWLDRVNRGGLIKVNGDIFKSIFKLEAVVRGIFNVTLIRKHHGEVLREVLLQAMIDNENVNTSWESLSRNIPNEALSMILKNQFMLKWIDMRTRSYVRIYVQILKRVSVKSKKTKISRKADPAVRKKLN